MTEVRSYSYYCENCKLNVYLAWEGNPANWHCARCHTEVDWDTTLGSTPEATPGDDKEPRKL